MYFRGAFKHIQQKMFKEQLFLILFVLFSLQGYSQKYFVEKQGQKYHGHKSSLKSTFTNDTLGIDNFFSGTPTQYYVPAGGYVGGSNYYNDKAKAQQYNLSTSLAVEEVILWFGAKAFNSGNPNSAVVIKLYRLDSLGTNVAGQNNVPAPGSVIDSVILPIQNITTTGYTAVAFSSLPIVYENFAAGIDITTLATGDSVGLMTTTDGDADQTNLAWEKWNDNSWHTMQQAWPLDIDFAIWPVVDTTTAGIKSDGFFNGLKMSQNQPNPARDETSIIYELQNNASVTFEVYDVTGKKVISINEGIRNKGKHSINLSTAKIAVGTYYYSLKADDNRITKKMVIAK